MEEYVFDIDPQPAVRMVYSDRWKPRPAKDRYMQYKIALALLAKGNKFRMGDVMGFEFFMPIPGSDKKYTKRLGLPHRQKPDLDNLIKAVQDSLSEEDSHVHTYKEPTRKVWAEKGKIIVRVYD